VLWCCVKILKGDCKEVLALEVQSRETTANEDVPSSKSVREKMKMGNIQRRRKRFEENGICPVYVETRKPVH